ncbi:hypothetical protein TWF106_004992 [Orbilia oligospora]|uniref:Uncharacterized protein n=1 Tax=Orbilia oligospora TaxID=2813651 RepID=A0A6G1MJF9_ORBOL|nr:hypothetical protein TWF788_011413 [Orbilia oligospora]KAF3196359.1 hypothetical protein TWF106_004992 [Orbilia oligospora]KAF3196993.1 hypothetical protein TWF679_003816 [Orbilia oligospora]KAF3223385.1 hypothetical protein TWF191_006398 [Orbilia oligospora]KAF3260998.1 hypothetical protein TWF192_008932 [Orbilia oligospora]
MPYRRTHRTRPVGGHTAVRTTRTKPTLMDRLTGRRRGHTTTTTTTTRSSRPRRGHHHRTHGTTAVAPVHHQKRRPGLGDKISGALMRIKGSLTRRPGLKAAGTRRQRGTDGRGSHRRHYY